MATKAEVDALADALWYMLDDMGSHGNCVSNAAKAQARVALEPWLQANKWPLDYALDRAQAVVDDIKATT